MHSFVVKHGFLTFRRHSVLNLSTVQLLFYYSMRRGKNWIVAPSSDSNDSGSFVPLSNLH